MSPVAHLIVAINTPSWQVPLAVLTGRLNFRILVSSSLILVQNVSKTSAFVTGKCPLKVKSAGVISKNGVKMPYFRTCALEKWGQLAFTRVGLLVNLYSVLTTFMVTGNCGTIYF